MTIRNDELNLMVGIRNGIIPALLLWLGIAVAGFAVVKGCNHLKLPVTWAEPEK